ncbi:MAG: M28 family peptidase [Candidatus Marinimicrobia bacterium]|nr:M28 family peptidase [Candidatus Neomarinimicrobiota bacterium]MCF7840460.1 M28 family peptidase [Candidatus Neomarinimicrobiota bacterium]
MLNFHTVRQKIAFTGLMAAMWVAPLAAKPFSPAYEWRSLSAGFQARTIAAQELRNHVAVLTSDSLEGRETPTAGMWKTAHYIARNFKNWGLTPLPGAPDFFYRYPVKVKEHHAPPELDIISGNDTLALENITHFRFLPFYHDSAGAGTDSLVFVGYGIHTDSLDYDDFKDIDVTNKIALFFSGEPQDSTDCSILTGEKWSRYASGRHKREYLQKLGAAGCIEILLPDSSESFPKQSRWVKSIANRNAVTLLPDTMTTPFLGFLASWTAIDSFFLQQNMNLTALRQKIDASLTPMSFPMTLNIQYSFHITSRIDTAVNVIAQLSGKDPHLTGEAVMLTAHMDHEGVKDSVIYRGADDNASGTAAVLAIARALAQRGPGRRTQLIMLVSGEEKGLLGSKAYTANPIWPLDHTVAEINIDMIGRNAPDSIFVIGSDMLSNDLDQAVRAAARWSRGMRLDFRYNTTDDPNRFYYRSDHYNFAKNNVPSVFYFSGIHEDYHKPTDTMEKLDFGKMERVTRMIYRLTHTLNMTKKRPHLSAVDAAAH